MSTRYIRRELVARIPILGAINKSICINLQGDMVNNIEKNVSNAAEYICRAKEETKKAVRYQKKSRRVCGSFWLFL